MATVPAEIFVKYSIFKCSLGHVVCVRLRRLPNFGRSGRGERIVQCRAFGSLRERERIAILSFYIISYSVPPVHCNFARALTRKFSIVLVKLRPSSPAVKDTGLSRRIIFKRVHVVRTAARSSALESAELNRNAEMRRRGDRHIVLTRASWHGISRVRLAGNLTDKLQRVTRTFRR